MDTIEQVKHTIENYHMIGENDKVLVAVSGGPDSLSLLHILYELKVPICVAHVNHGLRENADIDEAFVKDFCTERSIPFFSKKVSLNELKDKMTIEEAGRKIRYDFFYEIMQKENCTKLATAHNSNDNAETVLMNLIRGSGISGLKGIEPKRGNLIRPLIETSREDIEAYCKKHHLNPRIDETNYEEHYTRNKVRLKLIPYIEENINDHVVGNINRLSKIILEEEKFIEEEANKAYQTMLVEANEDKIIYQLKLFNEANVVIRKRIIKKSIINLLGNAKDIEKVHIDDIVKLCENNVGGKFLMPNKNIKVMVLKGRVEFERITA